jgi:uncharacterized protein with GYD domain
MAKFLIHASYTAEGLKGLQKDKASGRRDALAKAMESVGGKLESIYYSLGDDDVIAVVEAPDIAGVASVVVAASASGLVRTRTTALMTIEEVDRALTRSVAYRAPGK